MNFMVIQMRVSDLIKVAQKEIGYVEGKNNDTKYGIAYGMNNVYWCMQFIWWCFNQIDRTYFFDGNKCASCSQLMNWAKSKGFWVTKDFKPGDILIYKWKNSKNTADHCGICFEAGRTYVVAVEGNTSKSSSGSQSNGDGVFKKRRDISLVLGAYRPKYEKEYSELLKERAGLADSTIDYLSKYKYADDLFRKLATMK